MTLLAELPSLSGAELGRTQWRTITQPDIDAFAALTRDQFWIHVDPSAAARGPFGAPIAHGFLTLALIGGFWAELFDVDDATIKVNYGLDRVRFVAPVVVGSRVRMHARLDSVAAAANGWRLTVDQTIEIDGLDRPALVARSIYEFR